MNLFFDTSALVKLFSTEKGSEIVKDLISDKTNHIWISELVYLEIYCALYRKLRNKEFSVENLKIIENEIEGQLEEFSTIPLETAVLEKSKELIKNYGKNYGLRTLDALHIATWFLIAENNWKFVTSDKNQIEVIKKSGFTAIHI